MKVWVIISADEWQVLGVATSEEHAKSYAEADAQEPLDWRTDRHGRLINDKWEYELRPFELIGDQA